MATFPERLKLLRQNFGLSQQKLAEEIGTISKSSINMYERGDREPSLETMEAIADFFNVDLSYLFGRSDVPNSSSGCLTNAATQKPGLVLTVREEKLIVAYRSHPEMQNAVDRLLQLEPEAADLYKNA